MLLFLVWIPHEKIADTYFFSQQDCTPFLSYAVFEKIWMKSCQQNISKAVEARALKLDE